MPRTRLLVSVADATDAIAALDGGADIIDAKDPTAGALGAVSVETLRAIHAAVGGRRPVTAALGDAADADTVESDARDFAAAGASLVKVGFAGVVDPVHAATLAAAAVRGARDGEGAARVVVVAYADVARPDGVDPDMLIDVAVRAGARGVLLDTSDKHGPGLRALMAPMALAAWTAAAHAAGLLTALAGRLTADDLVPLGTLGADIVGVRGAACDGGRAGRVSAERVRALQARLATSGTGQFAER